jgi:acetyl-CoA carboxylase biotin carboxylase subunit
MRKILIANRGEIAVRVIRTCREMGLATVAVYSACDRTALHVRLADEAYAIGPDQASDSYLRVDKLIDVAARAGADAVHPGYGFLAENADFAEACQAARLTFIGPSPGVMRTMGSKTGARDVARSVGVPVVPGSDVSFAASATAAELEAAAQAIGFPLLVKAVSGGGGKGMRVVGSAVDLPGAVRLAQSEGQASFGDDRVYFERQLAKPRHIEVQLLGDRHGTVVSFVERECSIQRRHQKLIEETPSAAVTPELREQLTAAAAAIGRAAGYTSAGTIEFLVDTSGAFYFLEMNTRLQVEHPITEAVTGMDFVRAQIEIAKGAKMDTIIAGPTTRTIEAAGHAIEVRVYAENPSEGFLPSPGLITHLRVPSGPGIRDDSGVFEGWSVPTEYDPLVSKVIAWAPDRQRATARMLGALAEYDLRGINTTIGFCRELIQSPEFAAADFDTETIDRMLERPPARVLPKAGADDAAQERAAIAAAMFQMAAGAEERRTVNEERRTTNEEHAAKNEAHATETEERTGGKGTGGTRPVARESLWAQRARLENLR